MSTEETTWERAPLGLDVSDAPDFDALLAADVEPERLGFRMQGEPCHLLLRPMDATDLERYRFIGIKVRGMDMEKMLPIIDDFDLDMQSKRAKFIIPRTICGGVIRQRLPVKGEPGQTTPCETPVPHGLDKREQFFLNQKWTPKFWEWLAHQCERVNGLLPEQEKNSPASSDS